MSLKQLILIVGGASLICWLTWLLVINEVDPQTGGFIALLVFYFSLFFALVGTVFIITSVLRRQFKKEESEHSIVATSIRQSFFFSLTVILALFLQSERFLTWWNFLLLVIAVGAMEYFFLSFKKTSATRPITQNPATPAGYIPPDF